MADALLDQFQKNFEYNYWANAQFLKALQEMPQPPEKAVKLFAHVLFAMDVWLARLKKEDLSGYTNPHPAYSLAECGQKLGELHAKWKGYLSGLKAADLEEWVRYTNTQGKPFEMIARNIMVHVVNHSHYHRGQLATLVAQAGGNRPTTDFSAYGFEIGEARAL